MSRKRQVIIIHGKDNVGMALSPFKAGMDVSVEIRGRIEKIKIVSDVPIGHKFALKDMDEGEIILKYGEPIGQSIRKISRGEHVHTHNMISPPHSHSPLSPKDTQVPG